MNNKLHHCARTLALCLRKHYGKMLTGMALTLSTAFAFAQPGVIIKGSWDRRSDGQVKLYRVEHSRIEEISAYTLAKDGQFGFYFVPPYEGIYMIGTGNAGAMADKYKFYLKAGDRLSLRVNDSSYSLTGVNSKENQELTRWHHLLAPVENKALQLGGRSTYVDFFPDLEALAAKAEKYKALLTGNARFDAGFAELRRLDLYAVAVHYIFTPRSSQPGPDQYPEFYRNLPVKELAASGRLLKYPFGFRILDNMSWIRNRLNGGTGRVELEQKLARYANDTLKGEAVLQQAAFLKTYIGLQDLKQQYGKYILTADQAARFTDIDTRLAREAGKPGKPAINFTYPDLGGRNVSLADFEGKVVLVDVWATWCGPCKAELPSLKKLEKEMHGRDIAFISVSVDVEKDHQKWKDFVAKEELGGVQLFASGWSEITRLYNIKGIPRFMVFDKKGNIVTVDAPRPSNTELKLLLESELKK